jgi:hypothetical protein
MVLETIGVDQKRFSVQWVSAAEGIRFVNVIREFSETILGFGTTGTREGLDPFSLRHKLEAARMALEGRTIRMLFAKQCRQIKESGTHGTFPEPEKLREAFTKELLQNETLLYLRQNTRSAPELAGLVGISIEQVVTVVDSLRKKNIWSGELIDA